MTARTFIYWLDRDCELGQRCTDNWSDTLLISIPEDPSTTLSHYRILAEFRKEYAPFSLLFKAFFTASAEYARCSEYYSDQKK